MCCALHRASHDQQHVADEEISLPVTNGDAEAAAVDGPAAEPAAEHGDELQVTIQFNDSLHYALETVKYTLSQLK